MQDICKSFCLLKTEAMLLGKFAYIERAIHRSGLFISEKWVVRMRMSDVFKMYDGWVPRIVTIFRVPSFFELNMYLLEGENAIDRMYKLKHKIRNEIWGFEYKKGGFLHAPDSAQEYYAHKSILEKRIVYGGTVATDNY